VSLLDEIAAAADPALGGHTVADPGPGRFEQADLGRLRAFVLEAIYEAYLTHYGSPRAFETMDSDLALLAGDSLYALGLERLAEAGDLDAVGELASLISACAQAESEGLSQVSEERWRAAERSLSG
jgi:hypothetical protein